MSVVTDCHSAARLIAEGAICYHTDTQIAICDGLAMSLDSVVEQRTRPVLVCGTSDEEITCMVGRLERLGLAAWRVLGDDQREMPGRACCDPAAFGDVAVSRAE